MLLVGTERLQLKYLKASLYFLRNLLNSIYDYERLLAAIKFKVPLHTTRSKPVLLKFSVVPTTIANFNKFDIMFDELNIFNVSARAFRQLVSGLNMVLVEVY